MGKNNNSIKDFVYDSMDYIIIILIVVIVGSIIFWRLDFLFNEENIAAGVETVEQSDEAKKLEEKEKEKEEKNIKTEKSKTVTAKKDTQSIKEKKDNKTEINKKEINEKNTKKDDPKSKDDKELVEKTKQILNVEIPSGSDSTTIANILESSGAIKDAKLFLENCESMGLSTKLKAGEFEIEKGSSLEEVIRIITK